MPPKPHILSEDDFRRIIREEFAARDEQLGLDTSSIEKRQAIAKDFVWLRTMRLRGDAVAAKVGYLVLTAGVAAVIAVFSLGMRKL